MTVNRIAYGGVFLAIVTLVGGGALYFADVVNAGTMMELCDSILNSSFMSHGYCYLWEPGLVWLHVSSDMLIAIAYFSIPVTLLIFVSKRKEARFRNVFLLFGLFICFCGLTHLIAVYNVWHGAYWVSGGMKAATAAVSLMTALFLIRSLPLALSIPLPEEYSRLANELGTETQGRADAERKLKSRIEWQTQQLWKSDSRWRLLTEFIYSAVWLADDEGKVSQPMPGWGAFTGQSFEEYRGEGWVRAILPSDREPMLEHWSRCVSEGTTFEFETHLWNAERNRYIPVVSKGLSIRDEKGVIQEWLGAIYDISSIKEQEDALASSTRRLKAKNEQLEEFTYVASHDLREPLRKVQAYGDLLEEDFGSELPSEAVRYIGVMKNAANRMSHLLDEMLEYSKVSSIDLRIQKVDLDPLVSGVLEDLEVVLTEAAAVVELGQLHSVDGDSSQLSHVFQNLVSNAIKYRAADRLPKIRIESESLTSEELDLRYQLASRGVKHWIAIHVTDNGIGFDQQYSKLILKAFQRLHRRGEYEGVGMGLAICNRIIERHNGFMRAESIVGKGSTFTFVLPVITAASSADSML